MVEEALHVSLIVERQILMHCPCRQPRTRQLSRGDGSRSEQHAQIRMLVADCLDHREHGIGLADACRMEPSDKSGRASDAGEPIALGPPMPLFFAEPRAPSK